MAPAAVAEYKLGKVVCYTCTQNPQAVQDTVAQAVGIRPEDVTCHVTLLGGGFGRKSKPDYVAEAAILSKKLNKPVKVVWTREDDIHFDYFHAPAAMYMKAALDENAYEAGIKVSDADLASIDLERDEFHGEWNYRVRPRAAKIIG